MGQTRLVPPVLSQLLGGLGLYFLFTAYLTILLYWAGLYHHMFATRMDFTFNPTIKRIFLAISGTWLAFEISVRVVYGLQMMNGRHDLPVDLIDSIYNIYICVIGLAFSLFFMIYGGLIFYQVRTSKFHKKTKERAIRKLTFVITILSWTFLVAIIILIVIVLFNGMRTPIGAIFGLSAQFTMESVLMIEMFYVLKKSNHEK
ncbi:hypothetical protein SAMD00019534_106350 [Acytostelium subglobosum LB1]|uniref:hypothetical protein n=1 Tax=Acytostelium subglobosum LB1 TaxID=1410327 RepID=UPI0006448AA5|nr:hypothetical protein SAMD00019534_106350 [Acytostelium subglobosum LB1]GAM27459.1 hypothetical protein SAMD00019534_106350 [Acytostelium subglobosum LB1]|eukprot:XP_012749524.1 hypothetical protein SAMD00019534_106350 [Acytostelium subglobosum LB1]